jgi:hypothetical protein
VTDLTFGASPHSFQWLCSGLIEPVPIRPIGLTNYLSTVLHTFPSFISKNYLCLYYIHTQQGLGITTKSFRIADLFQGQKFVQVLGQGSGSEYTGLLGLLPHLGTGCQLSCVWWLLGTAGDKGLVSAWLWCAAGL